eukprot:762667-Hanusia_phi.AAC.7
MDLFHQLYRHPNHNSSQSLLILSPSFSNLDNSTSRRRLCRRVSKSVCESKSTDQITFLFLLDTS